VALNRLAALACIAVALAAVAAGCGSANWSGIGRSAVSGRVFSHGCPAQRPGRPCGGWLNGTLRFVHLACPTGGTCTPGALAASTHSDPNGRFRVALAPGRYAVIAVGLENSLSGQAFSVNAGRPARVNLSIRNGIE
jgi:hypothetical protein